MTEAKKEPTVVTQVVMDDGRTVAFAGKRKMLKSASVEGGVVTAQFDFITGKTLKFEAPRSLLPKLAAHGALQKIGDEFDGDSVDDGIAAVEAIINRLQEGEWGAERTPGDGFAGTSLVIRAVSEVSGKSVEVIKTFIDGKLAKAKDSGVKLSRQDLYASYRTPGTKTGIRIAELEAEAAAKLQAAKDAKAGLKPKISTDDLLSELEGMED